MIEHLKLKYWVNHTQIIYVTFIFGRSFVVNSRVFMQENDSKLRLTPPGFDFLFRTRTCALWQQTPPEPFLIP